MLTFLDGLVISVSKQMSSCFNFRFVFCDPVVQTRLLLNYCMSLYGCVLISVYVVSGHFSQIATLVLFTVFLVV